MATSSNRRPYKLIVDDLTRRIAEGELAEGEQLASITELADEYRKSLGAVSLSTVERAMLLVADRRLVRGISGGSRWVAKGARDRAIRRLAEDADEDGDG